MSKLFKLLAGALLLSFGLPGTVIAGSCESETAAFSSSIGSTTNCSSISTPSGVPLDGAVVGSGETGATFYGTTCDFKVTVVDSAGNPIGVGDSADESTTYIIEDPDTMDGIPVCQVKFAITRGNQASSFCRSDYPTGTSGDSMLTRGNNNNPISHRQLEICTDKQFAVPSQPVISLQKKVVRADIPDDINGGFLDPNCFAAGGFSDEAADVIDVIAPTEVAYCYIIRNTGSSDASDVLLTDALINLSESYASLAKGSAIQVVSHTVLLSPDPCAEGSPGDPVGCIEVASNDQVVNIADVSAGDCPNCAASDNATINVDVLCDNETQSQATNSGNIIESRGLKGTTRCQPKPAANPGNGDVSQSVGLVCDDSCKPKPECLADPAAPGCEQICQASGNWSSGTFGACTSGEPTPGNLPQCWEVLRDPGNNCNYKNPTPNGSDSRHFRFRTNPYLYYFPSSGGGNSVGTIYCILYPGETSAVCPAGSIVY